MQRFALTGDAAYVRLQVTSTYAANPFAHGIGAGLGEVRFEGTSGVPEPGTYALIFSGLVVLGATRLRIRARRA